MRVAAHTLGWLAWAYVALGRYLDERVQSSEELTPSIRVLIGKFAKIGLVLFAGSVALSSVGVDLTALTVFSGAIGLGVGFGLQKVVEIIMKQGLN
jgi:small-conductance mechanosensitive channel